MLRRVFSSATPVSALSLFQNSCYHKIDFKISENNTVHQAVKKFTAFNVGCLAVTNSQNHVVGVLSERDYVHKVALLGIDAKTVNIKKVCTYEPNMILARENDSIEVCMQKMLIKDCRHLLVVDDKSECVGLISMKDVVKELMHNKNELIARLTNLNTGKGGFFGSE
jgi:predicted transcriptional regulator